jgi:hypothetical protein
VVEGKEVQGKVAVLILWKIMDDLEVFLDGDGSFYQSRVPSQGPGTRN